VIMMRNSLTGVTTAAPASGQAVGHTVWLAAVGVIVIAAVALIGCSDGRLELAPVSGRVTVAGEPLAAGKIVFQPEAGRASFGRIEGGRILEVTTYAQGDGVPVGKQRDAVVPEVDENVAMTNPVEYARIMKEGSIPSRYHQAATSGLTAEIMRGQANELEFDIPRK
jgi:hypothetical protein